MFINTVSAISHYVSLWSVPFCNVSVPEIPIGDQEGWPGGVTPRWAGTEQEMRYFLSMICNSLAEIQLNVWQATPPPPAPASPSPKKYLWKNHRSIQGLFWMVVLQGTLTWSSLTREDVHARPLQVPTSETCRSMMRRCRITGSGNELISVGGYFSWV